MSNNGNNLGRFCIRADINPFHEGFRATADSLIVWCEERTTWLPFTAEGETEDAAFDALQQTFTALPPGTVIRSSTGFTTEQHVRTDEGWDSLPMATMPVPRALVRTL